MLRDWAYYRSMLKLPDFGPVSQDRWAIQLIRERKALPMIDTGDIASAIVAVRNLWASLPGAGYGQHENLLSPLIAAYQHFGGTVK